MQQKLIKFISVILVTTILYANAAAVISYAADTLLSEKELESQGNVTNNSNVEFDVYYDGGKHSATSDINSTDTKLNVEINVKKAGYLKNAVIDFSEASFKISQAEESDKIMSFNEEEKRIALNQINNGENIKLSLNISADKKDEIYSDMFNKDNNVKFIATYVNDKAEEISINKNIVVHTEWNTQNAKAKLEYEITKYIPYSINGVSKLITQAKVTSYVENSVLPIKESNIEILAPKINDKYPERVTIVANTTSATNGDEKAVYFGTIRPELLDKEEISGDTAPNEQDKEGTPVYKTPEWEYNPADGKIVINVKNEPVNGKIKWTKNTVDQYIVTYIYPSDVYEAVKDSVTRVTYEASSKISLYGNGTGVTSVTAKVNGYEDKTKANDEIVEFTSNVTETLNKGFLYNNLNATDENKKDTQYKTAYTVNIPYANVVDSLELQLLTDKYVTEQAQEKEVILEDMSLRIWNKEMFKIFDGQTKINLLDSDGTIIDIIDVFDLTAQDEYYVISLPSNVSKIQFGKPAKEGNITFEIVKNISKNINYNKNDMKQFTNIKTSMIAIAKNAEVEIAHSEKVDNIKLEEPTQKVGLTINNNRLSTVTTNQNIEITATLENDSIDDIMYENPTIKINLPANIETLDLKSVKTYFDDELQISETRVIENEDGTKSILAKLTGIQTKYNNVAAKGATIVFTADITLHKLTPTTNTKIEVIATNGDTENTVATNSVEIKYIAPTGVVATNSMIGYNGNEILEAINGEAKKVTIPAMAEQKELTFTMNVINNYENSIDNVVILGRTPALGNKDITTSQDLGSTVTLPMISSITTNGIPQENIKIYYSDNTSATSNLSDASNKWTDTVTDYSKIASYMIVLNNYTMETGSALQFSYKALIPANIGYEKTAYQTYAVLFNNNQPSGTIADKVNATKIGVSTGSIAKLEATLTAKAGDGTKVPSGSILEYELTIKNNGTLDAENVVVEIRQPDGAIYSPEQGENYERKTFTEQLDEQGNVIPGTENKIVNYIKLGTIKANTTITKKLTFSTANSSKEEKTVTVKADITYGENLRIETNSVSNILTKVYFITQVITSNMFTYKEGDTYSYRVLLKSSESDFAKLEDSDEDTTIRKNTTVTVTLPEQLQYESIQVTQYDSKIKDDKDITSSSTVTANGNVVTVNIGDLDGGRGKTLIVNTKIGTLPQGKYEQDVEITANVRADGSAVENIENSSVTINKPGITVTQTCNIPEGTTISSAENFTYTFTIENLSNVHIRDINLTDFIPSGVQFKSLQVVYEDGTTSSITNKNEDGSIQTKIHLSGKAKATVKVNVSAKSLSEDTKIANKAKISQEWIETIETNEITHTVKRFEKGDLNINPGTGNEQNQQTKKIIGTIWVDENKDGRKDAREPRVSGVKVLLLDNVTGNIAVDAYRNQCITTTGKDGAYMFNNIKAGKYSVIFFYDSSNYSSTEYRKQGVSDSENSDAIDKTVVYEGKNQIAAVTEEIVVSEENRYDIDLGIVEEPKFDLRLEKTVKSITVNNTKSTSEHVYNSQLAKIDFEAKYAASSSMAVEYTIKITNEGGIEGYAKKIADYLPAELKFNSELNKDWYEGKDGVIYNNSLANTLIKPGESKEISLVLIKNMNSEDFGMISNSAEIYEASNDYGILDVDSIPGNKLSSEDDYSTANVLTTIKTGGIVVYTTITMTVIAIIGTGLYLIKKKVLR